MAILLSLVLGWMMRASAAVVDNSGVISSGPDFVDWTQGSAWHGKISSYAALQSSKHLNGANSASSNAEPPAASRNSLKIKAKQVQRGGPPMKAVIHGRTAQTPVGESLNRVAFDTASLGLG